MEQTTTTLIAAGIAAAAGFTGVLTAQWWQRRTSAFSIRYSQLHRDRVLAMVEIYGKLYALRTEVWEYIKLMRYGTENVAQEREAGYVVLRKSMDDTHSYYRQRRFYFDQSMYGSVEKVFDQLYKIEEIIHPHHMSSVVLNKMDVMTEERKRIIDELDGVFHILNGEVKSAMATLENRMRRLFGVEVEA